MKFKDIKVFREERYSIEQDVDSGKYYLSFPVFNGLAEYNELYEIPPGELELILGDEKVRMQMVEKSRRRENDDRLLFKPGRVRGTPC